MALSGVLVAILATCLLPTGAVRPKQLDLCVLCGANGAASLLLNVILFVPLGVVLRLRGWSLRRITIVGALLSLGIETLQLGIPGRHTALSDLLANTLGAAIGALAARKPLAWLLPSGRAASVASALVTTFAAGMLLLTAVAYRPAVPSGEYYGQWDPRGVYAGEYGGRVLDASIDGLPLPSRPLDSERVRAALAAGSPIEVRWLLGRPTTELIPIFRLIVGPLDHGVEALQVGVDGHSLVLTPRLVADDWRLSRPEVQVEDALAAGAPGDTVIVRLAPAAAAGWSVRFNEAAPWTVGFNVGRGWSLFYATFVRSERTLLVVDHAWLLGLAAIAGWFAPTVRFGICSAALMVLVAAAAPGIGPVFATSGTLFASLSGGVLLGYLVRRAVEGAAKH